MQQYGKAGTVSKKRDGSRGYSASKQSDDPGLESSSYLEADAHLPVPFYAILCRADTNDVTNCASGIFRIALPLWKLSTVVQWCAERSIYMVKRGAGSVM